MSRSGMMKANSVIHRSVGAFDSPVDDELILVQIETDAYFSLGESGKAIWELLETPMTLGDLCSRISNSHGVDPSTFEADVVAFLVDLEEANLIRIDG